MNKPTQQSQIISVTRPYHTILILFCVLSASTQVASAHPFHASLTEAEWNEEAKRLEVTVKLDPNDLEKAVRRITGRTIDIEEKSAEKAIRAYLTSAFRVRADSLKETKPIELKWIGYEVDLKNAWLYFEVPLPAGPTGIEITNTLLHGDVHHQKNYVTVKAGEKKASLVCSESSATHTVQFEDKQENQTKDSSSLGLNPSSTVDPI